MHCQTLVLGAGIVGVSTALHLQARGRQVILIDRDEPGSGTSHGNAGLIERSSVIPYAFPRQFGALLRYGLNRQPDVRYSLLHLPKAAPWLLRYWQQSSPRRLAGAAADMLPLVQRCVEEHDALIDAAGLQALVQAKGWIEVYRDPALFEQAKAELKNLARYGLQYEVLERGQLQGREHLLDSAVVGGIHWLDPKTVSNPGALTRGYAALFVQRGGTFLHGDACSLRQVDSQWQVDSQRGPITADEVVACLGPQSADLYQRLGYQIPLGIKRGYHMHYGTRDGAQLQHAICDTQGGYVLAPMARGVRLTTGIEFAASGAAGNEIQLKRCEALARKLFPALGQRLDDEPWLGRRPCLPDMRPVIGPAPRHKGLWFNFGHAHHGLTLGPVSGRLLAELLTGEHPFTDPAPYSAARFD
ncbi:FAD-dependent oxidoreductase [Pseudomonas plecoglossicida]|uniref:FAD-binding oxidoreductase n=1 Tax=Pseudomonas plecoglossicida TaxID=70775 RepID=A0AAD0QTB1_PSEDL|nr:FAD-binding oxidoreductase [Pseudomonas plecoglossicida]AXM94687.1 FAD-binding oxidoreductase [Pseudomonas plecoglossicida]EPB96362.1 FAD dependent oxidoreductase [Pseudomonas plecoglossicida NB2011]QLB55425.1 FAD-binding oxidoreductase [Pseudomonas plecoglossicida]GLR38832.1 FAD-dependent oxidoreductase [Pseudomonas plecoglossicida]